jgi:hypothetical protein
MTDSDDTTTIPTVQPPPSSAPPPPPFGAPPPPPPPPPAWRPPRDERRRDVSLVFGVILLLIGLWFFASRTLGLTLPRLEWSQLWPILLIGLGVWIVLGAFRRPR